MAQVIEEEFGVRYHRDHVSRLLKQLQWTAQMPIRRAIQRDEPAIKRWRAEVWPKLRKRAWRRHRVLVFEDESGFYLLPGLVRTYAPEGQTPVIHEKQTRDHLSVMGGMTPEGKVYTLAEQDSLNGLHVIEFLTHLLPVAGERLLLIWDGSSIHRRTEVRDFVSGTHGKVWLEATLGYAPDLNPWDEDGWHHLKHVQMRNVVCRDLEELHEQLHLAVGRLRQSPDWFVRSSPKPGWSSAKVKALCRAVSNQLVIATCGQQIALGTVSHRVHDVGVGVELSDLGQLGHVPLPHGFVGGAGRELLAVGRPGDRVNLVAVAGECPAGTRRNDGPELDAPVTPSGQECERLGKEGHGRDRPGTSTGSERLTFGLGGIGRGQVKAPG